jgi:hypothetical protein
MITVSLYGKRDCLQVATTSPPCREARICFSALVCRFGYSHR